jgi:hypothetical protein
MPSTGLKKAKDLEDLPVFYYEIGVQIQNVFEERTE